MDISPALLPLLCLFVVLEYKAGDSASGGDHRCALVAHLPHRQRGFEYVRVCPGLRLQGWSEDGPGECLPGVVRESRRLASGHRALPASAIGKWSKCRSMRAIALVSGQRSLTICHYETK